MGDITLHSPVQDLPGVGSALARGLHELGIWRLGNLVAHLPARYEHLEGEIPLDQLEHDHLVSARGEVTATRLVGSRRKTRFEAVLHDGTARLDLVWFNAAYLRNKIKPGHHLRVHAKVRLFQGARQMANPEFEILDPDNPEPVAPDASLRPVYPASEHISSRVIARLIARSLPLALPLIEEHLPQAFLDERQMPILSDAYRLVHAPKSEGDHLAARRRLAYDELLFLQLGVFMRRAQLHRARRALAIPTTADLDGRIRARIPFALTDAQDRVVADIAADLDSPTPANRLIQGDVGSGKTVVALYAMLQAVASGHQAALMAPTEILAEQHYSTISYMLRDSNTSLDLLTGSTPAPQRMQILGDLESGEIHLLVGTHALLSQNVRFHSLAVAIIDEQHRFGVHQRAALRAKADDPRSTPHTLVMTATPIPRTLALTVFGDLDLSTIDALPPGRQPITTRLVHPAERAGAYAALADRIHKGQQAYIVAPMIEPTDPAIAGVQSLYQELSLGPLAHARLAVIHAQLHRSQREDIMLRFRKGEIDALIATTIIEVGVDVPNASAIVIENAERFGLAQLHQLRGRVGRGDTASLCLLIADPITEDAIARLDAMTTTSDGFVIAQRDLEIRGPGEFFGTAQSGLPPLRVANLTKALDLLTLARKDARQWILTSPTLDKPAEALLKKRLLKAVGKELGLVDVA